MGDAGQPDFADQIGSAGVLVYLFQDENTPDTFAYSMDVTGRSIPRATARTKWSFMAAVTSQDLRDFEEVTHHLRRQSFYVFRKPDPP